MNHIDTRIKALYKKHMKIDKYFIKQKLIGFTAAVMGVVSVVVLDGDITAAVLMFPLGIWLTVTKSRAIYEEQEADNDV